MASVTIPLKARLRIVPISPDFVKIVIIETDGERTYTLTRANWSRAHAKPGMNVEVEAEEWS